MFCYKCGKELEDGSNFCPNCGTAQQRTGKKKISVDTEKIKTLQNRVKANKKLIAIVCVAVVILGAVIGVIASTIAKKKEEAMVDALIGTQWRVLHLGIGDFIYVTFVDEDTMLLDLGPGEGTDEYRWWVAKVDGNRLVFNSDPVAQDIYDEGGSRGEWYSLNYGFSVTFNKSNGSYIPYAMLDANGNIKDTQ